MPLVFSTSQDPDAFIARILQNRLTVRIEDIELVAEEQKTRILERTARGVDYEGRAFAPYSTKGPYYYYPNGRNRTLGGVASRIDRAAARRFHAKINKGRGAAIGEVTRGGGIKFASYAEFKKALGRQNVDLTGPRAPHMLQAFVKTISGPLEVRLGIYDPEKAAIASGHQTGVAKTHLPQRKFFAVSDSDREAIKARLVELLNQRRS